MAPSKSTSRLHNDTKHTGEQSFHEMRQVHDQYFSDNEIETTAAFDASMYDDGHYTFPGVAQEARVIRASPIVKKDEAEVPRYNDLSDKLEEDTESPIMGRTGNVPSPICTFNVPAYKTKPLCDWTNMDIDEEDRVSCWQVAQMMNKQVPIPNERPDSDPPESSESARIVTLISESPVGSINRTDQPVDGVETPVAGEGCARTSNLRELTLITEIYKCTNTVRKFFSCAVDIRLSSRTLSPTE